MAADWLVPELSLPKQLERECDRRKAARLDRDGLSMLADKLICDWYQHDEMISRLMRQVQRLEVENMLATATPSSRKPSQHHFQWAKELLHRMGR
jgi:hypothetical protein